MRSPSQVELAMPLYFSTRFLLPLAGVAICTGGVLFAQEASEAPRRPEAFLSPEDAGPDFAIQGEYTGEFTMQDGGQRKVGVQVVALGDGKFATVGYPGGLPGAGWEGDERYERTAEREGDDVVVRRDGQVFARIADGKMSFGRDPDEPWAVLDKVERASPTLGREPPEGAVVLFDGSGVDAFPGARMTDDGLLMQGATSEATFQDFEIHVEFRLPFMPTAQGQARGNSGLYFQGRYEVQMLDSFGLSGEDNECGGIYTIKKPSVNMCFPPLSWQTYDAEFTAAKYNDAGEKTANARVTIRQNGVLIQDNVELPHGTTAAPIPEGPEPGPIYLQDHGNPVRYRNIWVLPK